MQLPQLSHLFMIGSPLGLFVSLNSVPSTYQFSPHVPQSGSPQPASTPLNKRRARRNSRSDRMSTTSSAETPEKEALELGQTDPDVLIPHFACRRIYNIFHSYDPIAYRLEPLLLRHYSHVNPVVLPTVNSFFSKEKHQQSSSASSAVHVESMLPESSSLADLSILDSEDPQLHEDFESSTESSEEGSHMSEMDYPRKLYKRLSITSNRQVYKQHNSRTFRIFSRLVTRRSSHVTTLGPALQRQNSEPLGTEKRLRYRVDYEWQKSFSPLAVLGAHHSYWDSRELAFFLLYQIFGHPDSVY